MKFPRGFTFGGVECGIKQSGEDVGLIVSGSDCVAAGVYTKNIVRAACIDFNRQNSPMENCRAVVVNSGNANACTGELGIENCLETARTVAKQIGCDENQVLVLSTGIIGQQLPMSKLVSGIETLSSKLKCDEESFGRLASAFMTTDRFQKTASTQFHADSKEFILVGIAKGAGMIGPNMATMLAVVLTDFPLSQESAQQAITNAVNQSFNRISVDGHTSTNDAVILLSSRSAANSVTDEVTRQFQASLESTCIELAKMIPSDGEGASHLIEVTVDGANSDSDADRVARTIASSNLVKTAVSGNDPNWGRIVSAAGYSGVEIEQDEISLQINGIAVFENGTPIDFDEKAASQSIGKNKITEIRVAIGKGSHQSKHWTSDLTTDYVILNSEYHT